MNIKDNELSFEEKLNYSQLKHKAIKAVHRVCNSKELYIKEIISSDDLEKLINITYTSALLENYSDIKMEEEDFEDSFNELVQCMFDIISKYILNNVTKQGL
ncbi:hypothetical protein ABF107_003726 [Vibrio parahaemolyticus]|uniref:hypothetical protein n=1 Tax=Vibrio parahaemolyticus TaxID=670 RepID=UPI001A27D479|nr:hypothetical protein [Vibrio parahaemolyticus]EHR6714691.1 hypothetical protein [Vibrio parahaemolyticus]ELA9316293.1 hypothetical protein [Vibrio parahaemolyticus]MCG6481419.1 hypothetical protein [Vibrio parahaemolyticus]HAS6797178.1 hypothetical protein [Vibrio parahaemolyticus]